MALSANAIRGWRWNTAWRIRAGGSACKRTRSWGSRSLVSRLCVGTRVPQLVRLPLQAIETRVVLFRNHFAHPVSPTTENKRREADDGLSLQSALCIYDPMGFGGKLLGLRTIHIGKDRGRPGLFDVEQP